VFKSQNSVNGLPLQLGKDEVALALSQGKLHTALECVRLPQHSLWHLSLLSLPTGWARAQAPVLKGLQDILLPAPQQGSQEDEDVPGTSQPQGPTYRPGYRAHGGPRKRRRTGEDEMTAQYVMYYELLGAYGASRQAAARQRLVEEQQQQQQQQQQQLHSPSLQRQQQQQAAKPATSQVPSKQAQEKAALAPEKQQQKQKSSTGADAAPQGGGPGWKAAVADGSAVFTVPMTGREAAQAEGRLLPDQDISSQVVETYPRSPEEQLRHAVFQDLHTRGWVCRFGSMPRAGLSILRLDTSVEPLPDNTSTCAGFVGFHMGGYTGHRLPVVMRPCTGTPSQQGPSLDVT
jgi:hypothetical protein